MFKRQVAAGGGPFVRRMENDTGDLPAGGIDAEVLIAGLNRLFDLAGLTDLALPDGASAEQIMEAIAQVPEAPAKAPAAVAAKLQNGKPISPIRLGFQLAAQQRKARDIKRRLGK